MILSSKALKWFFRILISIIVLLILIRLFMPVMISSGIVYWFEKQQLNATVEEVRIDLGEGLFSINGLNVLRDSDQVLNLDQLAVSWSWSDLMDSVVSIPVIKVKAVSFGIDQSEKGDLVIAGIALSNFSKDSSSQASNVDSEEEPMPWTVVLDSLDFSNFNICYRQQAIYDYCAAFEKLGWQGGFQMNLADIGGNTIPFFAKGGVELDGFTLHSNQLKRNLASFDGLRIQGLNMQTSDSIAVDQFSVSTLNLLDRVSDELAGQVTGFEDIQINGFTLNGLQSLTIKEVRVINHEALLITDADKKLEIEEWLVPVSKQESDGVEVENHENGSFQFAIEKLDYHTDKTIEYRDNSLQPPLMVNLNGIQFSLLGLDSSQPGQNSQVRYSANYGEHGKMNFEGTARPLQQKKSFNLTGNIKGLDLRNISAITREAIGHSIKSGQLDAKLKLQAEKNELDSEVDLSLYHFELKSVSARDEEKINADFGIPLNSSLSLLRDSDNTIRLVIPVTGDLDNPDLDASDAITKATSEAITAAIINYYTPFGLVYAVGGLIDLASALSFEPVKFMAAKDSIDVTAGKNLGELIKLMNERPGVHLTLCALTNSADRQSIFPETAGIPAEELKLTAEQQAGLLALGENRSRNIKQYLTDRKIDASRLIICSAEHREGEGLSGVEISI